MIFQSPPSFFSACVSTFSSAVASLEMPFWHHIQFFHRDAG
jgi:hypothetical protein